MGVKREIGRGYKNVIGFVWMPALILGTFGLIHRTLNGKGLSMANIRKTDSDSQLKEKQHTKTQEPPMYHVVLHNDDYTTTDFVVKVLVKIFHKTETEATAIMMEVHHKGKGYVGVYPYDIAATKVMQVKQMAKAHEYPLKCTMERV